MPSSKLTNQDSKLIMSRRSFLKRTTGTILAGMMGTGIYSTWIEPKWLDITHISISYPNLPKSFDKKHIVHFSDLHVGNFLDVADYKEIIQLIQSQKADLICFTGDLFDHEFSESTINQLADLLSQLEAPLGKFSVLGNHDYFHNPEQIEKCWENSGFTLLKNKSTQLHQDGDTIILSGLDDALNGQPDFSILKSDSMSQKTPFHILLAHEPDLADDVASRYQIHLQLSGHSHGGQIQFPGIGPIITPPLSNLYPLGLYRNIKNSNLHLYTNRGIGTTILPFRFFSRPEITVITLTN